MSQINSKQSSVNHVVVSDIDFVKLHSKAMTGDSCYFIFREITDEILTQFEDIVAERNEIGDLWYTWDLNPRTGKTKWAKANWYFFQQLLRHYLGFGVPEAWDEDQGRGGFWTAAHPPGGRVTFHWRQDIPDLVEEILRICFQQTKARRQGTWQGPAGRNEMSIRWPHK